MRILGYYWGIVGVILILISAIYRLTPRVIELQESPMSLLHWVLLVGFVLFMLYSEGYKGFHLNFAPRVIVRARALSKKPKPMLVLLAPLVCMGYIHATLKRRLISLILTSAIIVLVLLVSHLSQPWRGIIDAGVVFGLAFGTGSIIWHWIGEAFRGVSPSIPTDFPESAQS